MPYHELRRVSQCAAISWHGRFLFLRPVIAHDYVILHETAEGEWTIYCGPTPSGPRVSLACALQKPLAAENARPFLQPLFTHGCSPMSLRLRRTRRRG